MLHAMSFALSCDMTYIYPMGAHLFTVSLHDEEHGAMNIVVTILIICLSNKFKFLTLTTF